MLGAVQHGLCDGTVQQSDAIHNGTAAAALGSQASSIVLKLPQLSCTTMASGHAHQQCAILAMDSPSWGVQCSSDQCMAPSSRSGD